MIHASSFLLQFLQNSLATANFVKKMQLTGSPVDEIVSPQALNRRERFMFVP